MCTRLLRIIGICSLFSLLIIVSNVSAQEKKYVFKLGQLAGATSAHGLSLDAFARAVEAESGGKIKINVVHSAALGSGLENIEQVRMGTVEMNMLWYAYMESLDKKFSIGGFPFAWSKRWKAYAAFNGELGDIFKMMADRFGIKILANYEWGYRHITNSVRPITRPEDLKGIKLRVPEVKVRLEMFRILGANPIPVPSKEIYTALALKTVDGQENPLTYVHSAKIYEVQKFLSLTKHTYNTAALSISKNIWEKLPKNYQQILQRNALKYKEYNNQLIRESEGLLVDKLKSLGMKVNVADAQSFTKAVQPVWEKYEPVLGEEIMNIVKKYTKEY